MTVQRYRDGENDALDREGDEHETELEVEELHEPVPGRRTNLDLKARARGAATPGRLNRVSDEIARMARSIGLDAPPAVVVNDVPGAHGARGVAREGAVHLDPSVDPDADEGRYVIAHEVVHVAQSRLGGASDKHRGAAEAEARDLGRALVAGAGARAPRIALDGGRAAADTGGGELVDLHEDVMIASHDIVGTWNLKLVLTHVPESDLEAAEEYARDATEGAKEAIRAVPAELVLSRSFRIRLKYRPGRKPEKIQEDARAKAAKAIKQKDPKALEKEKQTAAAAAAAREEVPTEEARDGTQAEREMAVQAVVDNLRQIRNRGAKVAMTFWVQRTAATLLGVHRAADGQAEQVSPNVKALAADLRRNWTAALMGPTGREVVFTFELGAHGWEQIKLETKDRDEAPPEAHTVAVNHTGYTESARNTTSRAVEDIIRSALEATDATFRGEWSVVLDDDRVVEVKYGTQARTTPTDGKPDGDPPHGVQARRVIEAAILPFTRGLGERTVKLVFDVAHKAPAKETTWILRESGVVRPATPGDEASDIVAEYRATHEQIIKQWREGVKDAAIMAASMGVEHVAANLIGGAIFKVAGHLLGAAAPRLLKLLKGNKKPTKEYLETLFARLSGDEKDEAARILLKLHKGEKLTKADEKVLTQIYKSLDDKIGKALTDNEKKALRAQAFNKRYPAARASATQAFEQAKRAGRDWQVHHRVGLEYAHLYPDMDINAVDNLIGLDDVVHSRISALWTTFRAKFPANKVTTKQIDQMAEIIDDEFAQWYHKVPNTKTLADELKVAEGAARSKMEYVFEVAP